MTSYGLSAESPIKKKQKTWSEISENILMPHKNNLWVYVGSDEIEKTFSIVSVLPVYNHPGKWMFVAGETSTAEF